MARCEVCGNEYERSFQVMLGPDETHTFDSFECAVHLLAPTCDHCGCRILGHGLESPESMYCSSHCAKEAGEKGARTHL